MGLQKFNFKFSFLNYETTNLTNNFEISASAMKLEGCDLIIGFPTIQKNNLIVLQFSSGVNIKPSDPNQKF